MFRPGWLGRFLIKPCSRWPRLGARPGRVRGPVSLTLGAGTARARTRCRFFGARSHVCLLSVELAGAAFESEPLEGFVPDQEGLVARVGLD